MVSKMVCEESSYSQSEILHCHLPGVTKEDHKNIGQNSQFSNQDIQNMNATWLITACGS
jgi:hypothetical protein